MFCSIMMWLPLISVIWAVSVSGELIRIATDVGEFSGILDRHVEFNGDRRAVVRFLGIPFAKPPVGSRRFRRPEVPDKHPGIYNATYYRPHCAQSVSDLPFVARFAMDEDCLYLNVVIPGDRIPEDRSLAVMIWIYGGAFRSGGADIYNGDILSAFNDVIVVTFNYRVNVFGFLNDGTKSSGNFGLWDQKMAIEWVHNNIEMFGGDVNNVTLFGESAGAASIIYQALHPDNEHLFQRMIAESGTALASWAIQSRGSKTFNDFALRSGCLRGTTESSTECLRGKSTHLLLNSVNSLSNFLPLVDGDFIVDDPAVLLTNQSGLALEQFASRDLLIGVNNGDGAYAISAIWDKKLKQLPPYFKVDVAKGVPKVIFDTIFVPTMLDKVMGIKDPLITKSVLYEYTDWSNEHDTIKVRSKMVDLSSDILFFVPAINTANKHSGISGNGSTYFYEFSRKPWFGTPAFQPVWLEGASHTMEIPYVFGLSDSFKVAAGIPQQVQFKRPREDVRLSQVMMEMWTNFAKFGNPNSETLSQEGLPEWPAYESDHRPYFRFTGRLGPGSIRHRLVARRARFWMDLVPGLQAKCSNLRHGQSGTTTSGGVSTLGGSNKGLTEPFIIVIVACLMLRLSC